MKNRNIIFMVNLLAGTCLLFLPVARAKQSSEDRGNNNSAAENVSALNLGTTGFFNTAHGWFSLFSNTSGSANTAYGFQALLTNTTGERNTAIGFRALVNNTTGSFNTAIGDATLTNSNGSDNTALGEGAGSAITTGSGNVYIGDFVTGFAGDETNTTRIRNIGLTPIVGGLQVAMEAFGPSADGRLGVAVSSRRYKEDIKPMDKASERLFALKPVTFRAKGNMDPGNVKHYGLIAEDVAAVDPDLVMYNPDGKPETLRFDSINAMLLNEFLKEHRNVQHLETMVA